MKGLYLWLWERKVSITVVTLEVIAALLATFGFLTLSVVYLVTALGLAWVFPGRRSARTFD